MSTPFARVLGLGLLSHGLAFATLFLILISMVEGGSAYTGVYLAVAGALTCIAYVSRDLPADKLWSRMTVAGFLLLGAGLAAFWLIGGEHPSYPLFFFLPLTLLLLRRLVKTILDLQYLRQSLMEDYRLDMIALVGSVLLALLFSTDPDWQAQMVPFFIAFFLLRLYAISAASKLKRASDQQADRLEQVQNTLPWLLMGLALLLAWMLHALGLPILRWVTQLLEPIFYAVGHVVEWLSDLFGQESETGTEEVFELVKEKKPGETTDPYTFDPAVINESVFYIVLCLLALFVLYLFYRQKQKLARTRITEGIVEVRTFMRKEIIHKRPPARQPAGPLTPLRRLYLRWLLTLRKRGFKRLPHQTALEHMAAVADQHPELQHKLTELTDYYLRERYGAGATDEQTTRAQQLVDDLATHRRDTNR